MAAEPSPLHWKKQRAETQIDNADKDTETLHGKG